MSPVAIGLLIAFFIWMAWEFTHPMVEKELDEHERFWHDDRKN